MLWRGGEAFQAALRLVEAAEGAANDAHGSRAEPVVWRQPIMRPAADLKQVCRNDACIYFEALILGVTGAIL